MTRRRRRGTSGRSEVDLYKAAAQAPATTRSYESSLNHFLRNGGRVPATPSRLMRYLAAFAGHLAVATLAQRLVAIHRAHVDLGYPSPVDHPDVRKTFRGIRRTHGTAQRKAQALRCEDVVDLLKVMRQQSPMRAARDQALLLTGFAGAFRRSELVSIRVEDLTVYAEGLEVVLRRSKTDQERCGRTVFLPRGKAGKCPVRALLSWLKLAGISTGYVFRPINRHDQIADARLSPQSVSLILKRAVSRWRGDEAARHVSGHSLRAGFVTSAAERGVPTYQIREVTGHRSDLTLAMYIRPLLKRKAASLF